MAAVPTFTKTGNKATTPAKLDKAVFGVELSNTELLGYVYRAYLANGRANLAIAKKRGEVSGGGKKPWRQKGTGRARVGSSRNPIWRGGGAAHGPKGNENYSIKVSTKSKRLALRQALSQASSEGKIKIIETFDCPDGILKPTVGLLKKLDATGKVLLVVSTKDQMAERATRNHPDIKLCQAKYLNVYDILNADSIIICKKSLEIISEWLGGGKNE